jgi:hypothetical protein
MLQSFTLHAAPVETHAFGFRLEHASADFAFAVHARCVQAEDAAAERPGLGRYLHVVQVRLSQPGICPGTKD